jgi:hypothetical protein
MLWLLAIVLKAESQRDKMCLTASTGVSRPINAASYYRIRGFEITAATAAVQCSAARLATWLLHVHCSDVGSSHQQRNAGNYSLNFCQARASELW